MMLFLHFITFDIFNPDRALFQPSSKEGAILDAKAFDRSNGIR